ncbi:unnamed protein product, partial [Closterium sp. Naga37s-1]
QVLLDCQAAWSTRIDGWVVGGDCSKAKNVTCDAKGMITAIDLQNNIFNGVIPNSIGKLSNLRTLNLHYNHLSGPIPDSLFKLTALRG